MSLIDRTQEYQRDDHIFTEVSNWPALMPFNDQSGPDFPIQALPEPLGEFVAARAESTQVPADLPACLVLGVASAAVARKCKLMVNQDWAEPLNLFMVVVMNSGDRKSPEFREITRPLEEREQELWQLAGPDIEMKKAERDIQEARLKRLKMDAAKAKNGRASEEIMQQISETTEELANFEIPPVPRLLADDATPEAIASLLAQHGGRMAIASTEGGLFENLAGRYSDRVPNIDVLLKAYSGDTIRVDRMSRPAEYIPNPALTVFVTIQPQVLTELSDKPGFRGRGLLARFLYSIPKSLVGYRSMEPRLFPNHLREEWRQTVRRLLQLPDPPEGEEHYLVLTPGAQRLFTDFRAQIELLQRPGGELTDIADWANKLAGTVARIAGVLHLLQNNAMARPWESAIDADTVQSAISIGDYFMSHAQIAFGMMGADRRMAESRSVWDAIDQRVWEEFTIRDLHQHTRRRLTVSQLNEALGNLEEMGYVRRVAEGDRQGPGRPPSPTFQINPVARTQNPHNPQKSESVGNFEDSVDCVYANTVRKNGSASQESDTLRGNDEGEI